MRPIIPSPEPYEYRNRITVHAQDGVVGFFRRDSNRLIDIAHCPISRDEVNRALPLSSRVRNFALLAEPFSQERDELTPTLKIKRRVVVETRRAQIDAMYRPSGGSSESHQRA